MKSSIFQITNSKIWMISALKVLKLNISRYRKIWPDFFCISKLGLPCVLKVISTTVWLSFKKTFRAEILQIFELVIWKIDDFINSFWLYLTFNSNSNPISLRQQNNFGNLKYILKSFRYLEWHYILIHL